MNAPLTRTEQKNATRGAIRAAARACFTEMGYTATQIAHITDRAGVAKGTFYVHYADKDVLLDEWLAEFNEAFAARIAPLLTSASYQDATGAIAAIANAFLDHWDSHRAFVRAYAEKAAAGIQFEELQHGVNPPMQALLCQVLERLAKEWGGHYGTPVLVIQGLLSMWQRLGLQFLFNPNVTREQVAHALIQMTAGALQNALEK
jgi:AcrR family transcriptional regulator